ncbi:hypothetical protein [Demequina pelophila]|uniref:hypothetical protein n=1 Tax=Demequina pelophila TaxID=1638984 RepID=UPI000A5407CA|nr:hypothetical protein [Demequina pelophila]
MAELGPLADDVIAVGRTRLVDGSLWHEVAAGGTTGWAEGSHLMYLGGVDDATSAVVDAIGSRPTVSTMPELGILVAQQFASSDPLSVVSLTVPATVGDLGEITYDVLGLGDDSVGGMRLHVFGTPSNGGFVLMSVERTALCLRGVVDEACV